MWYDVLFTNQLCSWYQCSCTAGGIEYCEHEKTKIFGLDWTRWAWVTVLCLLTDVIYRGHRDVCVYGACVLQSSHLTIFQLVAVNWSVNIVSRVLLAFVNLCVYYLCTWKCVISYASWWAGHCSGSIEKQILTVVVLCSVTAAVCACVTLCFWCRWRALLCLTADFCSCSVEQ